MKSLISLFLMLLLFNGQASLQSGAWLDYSWTASFDAADRVTSWSRSGTTGGSPVINSQSWNLDLIGNWTSVTTDGSTESRTHNDVHELTDISGGTGSLPALSYDDKGNLLEASQSLAALTWDLDNHLESVTSNQSGVTSFEYDALGRRVSKSNSLTGTTLFISHGQRE
ncbi:MAG: hypothetical protein MK132_23625 [Lentisphaerales bacterium]|nr:hypothetical protein [Lentisphaerales bacterium]